ncbi:DUF6461 domain-containing protein [Kitasatospora sp. YST-16]|uniref:DUF6461 domain-containing protein n=1 Tax=Kitasatospora sp. YST-16 TaxID=2998080 RepID=UPI00228515A9|nr:DUF6461 domain-containing protein [Kitasatospora sp. YST-16]WAL71207.1 DUF6461 domain-containing protein [Kitasatospora sp. YST-16]WNW37243.1 DUF6461 domain-containing protein [Streptomyces sp. Li-HN-5-13]
MHPTSSDYLWFHRDFPALAASYCLTLVKDLSPEELFRRLGGSAGTDAVGVDALVEQAATARRTGPDGLRFAGIADLGSWALMVEPDGSLGVLEEAAEPGSSGTEWVAHHRSEGDVDTFLAYVDSAPLVLLDPAASGNRLGRSPQEITAALRHMGFDLDSPTPAATPRTASAAFALAEVLTGVRLTPALLRGLSFRCGALPAPRMGR